MGLLINEMVGEYRIVESLGAGGMGEVYKAVHVHLGRVIAVKVLLPDLTDGPALERFYSEAGIQASLKHPGVAEYLGFYQLRERPCILMEYVDGPTLGAVIARRGALPPEEAVRVLHQIADVVAHFHAQGVVHRDLKPGNVKICPDGRVKILDFGIARHQRQNRITRAGAVIGTPESLAPEQISGSVATAATDVWQLGVLFYEMLTGRLPFASGTTQETYARILAADFVPVNCFRPGIPAGIQKIVGRCLRKAPEKRYRTAAQLCKALASFTGEGFRVQRRHALVAAGVVVLVIAVSGMRACERNPIHREDGAASVTTAREGDVPDPARDAGSVVIDTADGPAQVFVRGKLTGTTPFRIEARAGDRVEVVLKRSGFKDLPVQFETSERRNYTFALEAMKER